LVDHASRAAEAVELGFDERWPLDSPAAVTTLCGLNLAGLALLGEEPGAAHWLALSDPRLETVLTTLAPDGWWPTGFEDWNLLLPLLVRVADSWERLAERDRFDHGLFRSAWAVAVHGLAPPAHDIIDLDRVGREGVSRRSAAEEGRAGGQYRWLQEPCTWALDRLARRFQDSNFRLAAERWRTEQLGRGSPWAVLWEPARSMARLGHPDRPYHLFESHGLAIWRSSWAREATCLALASGPAYGVDRPQWEPGTALDADANHFLLWSGGQALACDSGRLTEPLSQYHNTVLVDGLGQSPPASHDSGAAGLEAAWLSGLGGSLVGCADGAYPPATGLQTFRRHLAFGPGYLLVWDLLNSSRPCRYEWLLHSHGAIETGGAGEARVVVGEAALQIQALRPHRLKLAVGEVVLEGQANLSQLRLGTAESVSQTQFLVLLAPCSRQVPCPVQAALLTGDTAVGARLTWHNGDREDVLFPTRGRGIVLDDLISDAASLALRRAGEGDWRQLLARRVSRILVPGGVVLTASQPVDVSLAVEGGAAVGEVESATGATLSLRCPFVPRGVLVDGQSGRARVEREERLVSVRLTHGRHHLRITGW
ncbi:MAG: heparinase II/III family protein, partial [Armatimonadetes bacterium]|nr:heparinase II/III family protein [Armatimonadota bacterium]